MHKIVIVGSGKIGGAICHLLYHTHDYALTVVDQNKLGLKSLEKRYPGISTRVLNASEPQAMEALLSGQHAVVNAAPYTMSKPIAQAAKLSKVHYLDLTEDVASTKAIIEIASSAERAFIPQCGLAPGFISIVAYDLAKHFDTLHNLHLRVGALPQFPSNGLKYNLTWSTDGLINEYLNPCEAIVNGQKREVRPLEELEHFSLEGADYEAFNTSGGLGTLCETLKGKVDNLNYRTVRYPGHRDAMKMLLQDLRLNENPDLLKDILEHAIPVTMQDVVLIFVTVSGHKDGQYLQETFVRKIYSQAVYETVFSAIQVTTAASICASLELLLQGKLPNKGLIKQEDIPLIDFINNRFGHVYESGRLELVEPIYLAGTEE